MFTNTNVQSSRLPDTGSVVPSEMFVFNILHGSEEMVQEFWVNHSLGLLVFNSWCSGEEMVHE